MTETTFSRFRFVDDNDDQFRGAGRTQATMYFEVSILGIQFESVSVILGDTVLPMAVNPTPITITKPDMSTFQAIQYSFQPHVRTASDLGTNTISVEEIRSPPAQMPALEGFVI